MSIAAATTLNATQLDQLSVDTIRFLSVDAVQKADSGHPGLPLGAAPIAYASLVAVREGKSVDTSMSFTPTAGANEHPLR